jgi:hypothetical protein
MSRKPLWNSTFLMPVLAALTLTACNQYSDGLVGDYVETSKCPANGCANQAASDNYLSLSSNTTSVVANGNTVTIGGDCYASTFPNNVINATVTTSSGAPVSVPVSSNTSASGTPACRKGRFDVTVATDARYMAANNVYTLKLQLVAYDAANTTHTNLVSGIKNVTIRK